MRSCHFCDASIGPLQRFFVTRSANNFSIVACVSLNYASFVSTFYAKFASSSCHGWVTFKNSISSSRNFYNYICSFLLLPNCTIHYTGVRLGVSSFNFMISALAYHLSLHCFYYINLLNAQPRFCGNLQ